MKRVWHKTKWSNLWRNRNRVYYARTAVEGKDTWKSLQTDLISIAQVKLSKALAQMRSTGFKKAAQLTLGDAAAVFLERRRTMGHKGKLLKPRSLDYRAETIDMVRRTWPAFDGEKAALVTEERVNEWANRARARYSATRFNGMLESLRGIFDVAMETGALPSNPARLILRARVQGEKFIPSREQFTEILRRLDSHPRRAAAALAVRGLAFTGLRPNEARNMRPEDVNLQERVLTARVTKNGQPRLIELGDQAVELFRDDLTGLLKAFKKSPKRALRTIARDMGLPDLTPYTFRHLHMTRLLECGVNVEAAASQAGHRDRGVTLLRTYVHPRREAIREQMRKVVI